MYVQRSPDKMAASGYSRLVNLQKEPNRMDPHYHHPVAYQAGPQALYPSPVRGSIQTVLPGAYVDMDVGKSHHHKLTSADLSSCQGILGYPPGHHSIPRAAYQQGYQQTAHANYVPVVKSDQVQYRKDLHNIESHPNTSIHNHQLTSNKSTNAHRTDAQLFPKNCEQLHQLQNQTIRGTIQPVPQLERVPTLSSQHVSSLHVKDNHQNMNPSHFEKPSAKTPMHLNYEGEGRMVASSAAHHAYVTATDRRLDNSRKLIPRSRVGFSESQRVVQDYNRSGNNLRGTAPETSRQVPVDPHLGKVRPASNIKSQQQHVSQYIQHDNVIPTSIHKDTNRLSCPPISGAQTVMYLNHMYATQRVSADTNFISKEAPVVHGSISTGTPLDLSRVPEKVQKDDIAKNTRDTESPLDLSVKTRKRCADTTISQYSSESGVNSPKRQMLGSQPPLNQINQHYRNHLLASMEPNLKEGYLHNVYHNQATSHAASQRHHTLSSVKKDSHTVRADHSVAKSSDLLSKASSITEQYRRHRNQMSNLLSHSSTKTVRDSTIDLSPYPYSIYSSNQTVIRCSPDSTNSQHSQHSQHSHPNKHLQQIPNHNTPSSIVNTEHFQKLLGPQSKSSKGVIHDTMDNKHNTLHSRVIHHQNPLYSKPASRPPSNAAINRNAHVQGHASSTVTYVRSDVKDIQPLVKTEPHMQLYPSYDKQSLPVALPKTCYPTKTQIKTPLQSPVIFKTHVKPPEIMGMPTVGSEKPITNTIQSLKTIGTHKLSPEQNEPKNTTCDTPKSQQSDIDTCDKYMEPLSIAIPRTKSDSNTKVPEETKTTENTIQAPAAPPRTPMLSRKQMIMNAVIQDENLKKYATNIPHVIRKSKMLSEFKTPRGSPSSPPSPKMPILSPQQKALPSVSPLHNDPPTLDLPDNPSKHKLKGRILPPISKRPLDRSKLQSAKGHNEIHKPATNTISKDTADIAYTRPEGIRRNSLPEKTWMYNKNIPVANVAPFVHSEIKKEPTPLTDEHVPQLSDVTDSTIKDEDRVLEVSEQKPDVTAEGDTTAPVVSSKSLKTNKLKRREQSNLKKLSSRKRLAIQKLKQKMVINRKEDTQSIVCRLSRTINSSHDARRRKTTIRKLKTREQITSPKLKVEDNEDDQEESTSNSGHLMSDPALLDREERALRRAIDQFNKMESGSRYCHNVANVRLITNTNRRAQELKRKAINRNTAQGRNNKPTFKGRPGLRPRGFIDFKPEVLKTRTRKTDNKRFSRVKKNTDRGSLNHRCQTRTTRLQKTKQRMQQDSDFENDEDYDDEDDDDDDATEYEYDSDEVNQDRVLRKRVSLRTRKRSIRRLVSDDSDSEKDAVDNDHVPNHSQQTSRRTLRAPHPKSRNRKQSSSAAFADEALGFIPHFSEESTDEEFDAAFCHFYNDGAVGIPAEVRTMSVDKTTGESGLHAAVRLNYQEAVVYYIKSGTIDVNVRDNGGYSPLHETCKNGNWTAARVLLEHGADKNGSARDGKRPLQVAVINNHIEIVRLLLAFGADPSIKTNKGKSLLHISVAASMSRFLQGYFADLNGIDSDGDDNPWQFSSSVNTGKLENGLSIFSDIPSEAENDINDLFDDTISSAVRVFDLDIHNIGRSESYVYGEDIQTQFNCNETRLRKLCTPEMDVIKIPTERFQRFFEHSVIRCPATTAVTICLIKYDYYKTLKDKLAPTTKCSNVSDLISYRNKATERKNVNKVEVSEKQVDSSHRGSRKNKTKASGNEKSRSHKQWDNSYHIKSEKSPAQSSNNCCDSQCADRSDDSSSNNNNNNTNNNNNNNNNTNNNNNNIKKRQSNVSPSLQVVLKKTLLSNSGKKSTKSKSQSSHSHEKPTSLKTVSSHADVSKFDFVSECDSS